MTYNTKQEKLLKVKNRNEWRKSLLFSIPSIPKSDFDGTYIKKINKYSKIIGKNILKK